jgi:hypothetical protein
MVAPRHLGVHPKEDARGNAATLSRVSVAQRIACAIFIERPDQPRRVMPKCQVLCEGQGAGRTHYRQKRQPGG